MYSYKEKLSWFNLLLAINAFMFLLAFFFENSLHSDESYATFLGAFRSDYFERGMIWTMVTTNFVHIYGFHFIANMISYYVFGRAVETLYGNKMLLIVYVFGGIAGVTLAYLYYVSQNIILVTTGASAGVYAFVGLLFGGTFRKDRFGMDLPVDRNSLLMAMVPAIIINFLPNVSWQGHLGGFIVGFIAGRFFSHLMSVQTPSEKKVINVLFALSVGILVVSYALLIINLLFNIVNL